MDFFALLDSEIKYKIGSLAFSGDLKKMENTSFNNGCINFGASRAMLELTGPGHRTLIGICLRTSESRFDNSLANVVSKSL